jgi:predicted neuraminidase
MTAIGIAVGALMMETLDGHAITMDNYGERRGTVVVFLSSRCPVTGEAIGSIDAAYERTRLRDVLFVGVCANDAEPAEELRTFCQRRGVRFPVYKDPGGAVAAKLKARVTPAAYLLDRDGVLVYRGGLENEEAVGLLKSAIASLLKKQGPDPSQAEAQGTPITQRGSPSEVDDPYGTLHFAAELIFDSIPGAPVHHCSTLAEAANGDLVCVWYGGSYESADDQVLFVSRRKQGERAWSQPEVLVKGAPLHPPGNAVVFRAGPTRLGLIWGRMDASRPIRRGAGWGECQLMYRYSNDHGYTWSEDAELDGFFGALPRNAPIALRDEGGALDGALAVPLTGRRDGKRGGFLLMTTDEGATWSASGLVQGGSQPTVIQRGDGSLLALLRSEPWILQSESCDLGRIWSKPERTELRCPGSGIAMRRLQNGHLLLVFNNSARMRSPLNVIRSLDEGKTWDDLRTFEADAGEYSYPCVVQTADGMIHVTYTFRRYGIKHVEFNEDWIEHLERPN